MYYKLSLMVTCLLSSYFHKGIINITPAGIITRFNHAAEAMFGWPATEIIGQNISLLMPEKYIKNHDSYLQNYLSTGVKHGKIYF